MSAAGLASVITAVTGLIAALTALWRATHHTHDQGPQ